MIKKLCLLLMLLLFPVISFAEGTVIALCYHSFLGRQSIDTDFSISVFSNQIATIENLGYSFVTMEDVLSNNITGDNNILITIDDGNHSINEAYESVFKVFNIEPVLFIYPSVISTMDYALTYDEIRDMIAEGAFIGGHGYHHLFINRELYDSDDSAFKREIYKCMKYINLNLGFYPDVFAYPYGSYSDITLTHLELAGWKVAFTIDEGEITIPLENNDNILLLPRYMVTKSAWDYILGILTARMNNEV